MLNVLVPPTTSPWLPSEYSIPATVASGPLFEIVVPVSPRMMPAGAAAKVAWLAIVRIGTAGPRAGKEMMRVPRTRAERPKET